MKKVRNLTLGGIQQKMYNLVLSTNFLIVAAYTAVFFYQGNKINTAVTEISRQWDELTAAAEQTETAQIAGQFRQIGQQYTETMTASLDQAKTMIIVLLIIGFLLGTGNAVFLANRIVKPMVAMTKKVMSLGGDNLRFEMEDIYRTGDEIEILAGSFAEISGKTLQYIDRVKTVTAENERIGTELSLATRIQANMLPNIFPAFPERSDFDIYASMTPAKAVGGDFYDFFLIDDDHLGIVIADVSGKGVPAALFMMASKIMVQNTAMSGKGPAEVLRAVNEQICSNNHEEMFVTVWFGILDLNTGKIIAANAGHEYPALQQPDGSFALVRIKPNFVIGGMPSIRYKEYELQLEPGGKLFLYTDGVGEATDPNLELYGTDRLLEALNRVRDGSPKEVLDEVSRSVAVFADKEPQADDLTMLCIQYKGKKGSQRAAGSRQ